jgi:hypothetical protein
MSVASAKQPQEAGRFDTARQDKGGTSYLPSNARPVANRLLITVTSRGAANTAPSFAMSRDATESALDVLASALNMNVRRDRDVTEQALASLAEAIMTTPPRAPFAAFEHAAFEEPPDWLRSRDRIFRISAEGTEALAHIPRQDNEMPPTKIISLLTGAIAAMLPIGGVLIGVIYSTLRSDLDDLKKSSSEMVKTISSVDKQAAVTNQKLEDILKELQKPRR